MLLLAADAHFLDHDPGRGHPERPARLEAVRAGIELADLGDAVAALPVRRASRDELERVHAPGHLERLERLAAGGGGRVDADTTVGAQSWDVALAAAGAGLAAVEALARGEGDAAFLAVRPPGHHATPDRAMGFCLLNNVAVTAAALVAGGERVLVLDWDAHHGNGTEEIFWRSPEVLYVSMHEWPLYPGTGRLDDVGEGPGFGATLNLPFPAGTTGEHYLAAFDTVVAPLAERFGPTWVLVSAGYDAHRADPLTGLGLTSGDYADLAARAAGLVPGRLVLFLEGGYDLEALRDSVAATLSSVAGRAVRPERSSEGGPGAAVVRAARDLWVQLADL